MAVQIRSFWVWERGLLFIITLSISSGVSYGLSPLPRRHVALFVFGDSLFDPGNNVYLNNTGPAGAFQWPYGETFFQRPTGRLSDGRLVPDFIAEFFKLPIWRAYLAPVAHNFTHGANFASAGAGVLPSTNTATISLTMQLNYFKQVVCTLRKQIGIPKTNKLLNSAVFLISMGGNDYFGHYNTYPNASPLSVRRFVGIVNRHLIGFLREIYFLGGRKIAFQNVGALGCNPGNVAKSADGKTCIERLSAMARLHNYELWMSLAGMGRRLPGFRYAVFDYYHAMQERVLHPARYGFETGTGQCYSRGRGAAGARAKNTTISVCRDPRRYVYFDEAHPTEACNWQLAKLMWKGKRDVVGPYNFRQLYRL